MATGITVETYISKHNTITPDNPITQKGSSGSSIFFANESNKNEDNIAIIVNSSYDYSIYTFNENGKEVYEEYGKSYRTTKDYSSNQPIIISAGNYISNFEAFDHETYFLNSDYREGNDINEIEAQRVNYGKYSYSYVKTRDNETGEITNYNAQACWGGNFKLSYNKNDNGTSSFTIKNTTSGFLDEQYERTYNFNSDGSLDYISSKTYDKNGKLTRELQYYETSEMPEFVNNDQGCSEGAGIANFAQYENEYFTNENPTANYQIDYDKNGKPHKTTLKKPETHKNAFDKFADFITGKV